MDEQQATIRFLKAMAPTVIETHISMIFLDEHYAYKSVSYTHLDVYKTQPGARMTSIKRSAFILRSPQVGQLHLL